MKPRNLEGMRFGRLVALRRAGKNERGLSLWQCKCDCGAEKIALARTLISGGTKSCGCLHLESSVKNLPKNTRPIGFERITCGGYVEIKTERGYVRKHVLEMELHIGRRLNKDEVVHHIDRNRLNNSIENLQLMTHGEHTALHNKEDPVSSATGRKIAVANQKFSPEAIQKARQLVSGGLSQREVGLLLGMSQITVSRAVRNLTYVDIYK